MMRAKSKTPQIRFKGFSEEWNQHKLGELLVITSASRVHKNEWRESGVRFFRSSDVVADYKGLSNNKAFISFDLYKELSNKSGYVQKNDLLVTGGGSIGIPYLVKNNEPLYFKDADLLWLKNSNDINGNFLYTFFSTPTFRSYVSSITHIGTISHYTIEQAKSTPINLPVKKEQDIIGDYFQNLDKLIEQKEQKYQKLRQFKTAMLSKMFPKNGAATPEIRFKGFSGEWEEKKLGEVLDYIQPTKYLVESTEYDDVYQIPVLTAGKTFILGYTNETTGIFKENLPVIIFDDFTTTTKFVDFPFKAKSSAMKILTAKEGVNIKFIFEEMQIMKYEVGGHERHWISKFSNFFISLPNIDEQTKIGNYFQKLDTLIDLHAQELDKLRHIKKASLEKMFV